MGLIKNAVRATVGGLGYDLVPRTAPTVRFENFSNLARAYEQMLNDAEPLIPSDEMRPKLLARLRGTPPTEAYAIVQGLWRSRDVAGDVCEFGVAQGETSALIANEIVRMGNGKTLHLFDSFEGLPKPTEKDELKDDVFGLGSMEAYTGTMSCGEEMVRARLAAISFPEERHVIHKGFVEPVLAAGGQDLPRQVSFAYLDFDFYEPIKVTLEYLHAIMPRGAVVVVDDYDFFSTGAKTAVDEFVEARNQGGRVYDCVVPPPERYGHFAVLTRVA